MSQVPYSPVQTVEPASGGSGASYQSVPEASPAAFGAQIGQAEEKLGAASQDLGKMYMQRANEASANDKIVNQWAPTVTALSQDYYSKQGKDAVAGFNPYIEGLQRQRTSLLENATPAESEILNQYMTRHIAQEYDGAMRHQVQQMDAYENQMSDAFVGQQTNNAVNAGSNPDVINSSIQAGKARIQMHGLDRGQSPEVIQQQQMEFAGKTVQAVVSSAVARNDLSFANSFFASNKDNIPGAQQVDIYKILHSEDLKTWASQANDAADAGLPLPHSLLGGAQTTDVKSTVARVAQSAGVDPNASMMIAGLESSFGQNLGARGDIGQTGKPAANMGEQAQNLVVAQKQAQEAADKAVGGTAAPWQMYTVYQQGVGGGVALLKPENANLKAVDVVSQFYSNPKDALAAIQKNGGNATMTASQFTDMLKQKCETIYGQVKCDTTSPDGQPIDLGKAILAPHQQGGIAQQPTTNPIDKLTQYNSQLQDKMNLAQQIPDVDQRNAFIEELKQRGANLKAVADAYKETNTQSLREITSKPDFLSVNDPRITPKQRAFMAQDQSAYDSVYRQAERNRNVANGGDKSLKLGNGFSYLQQQAYEGKLSSTDMFYHLGDDLSQEGFDKLKSIVKPTVGSVDDKDSMASFLKYGHERIVHSDLFQNTPDAEKAYQSWFSTVSNTIAQKQKDGVPLAQMIDPHSKDYVGGTLGQFLVPVQKQLDDRAARVNGLRQPNALPGEFMRQPNESIDAYLARVR